MTWSVKFQRYVQWHKWTHIYHTGTSATHTDIFRRKPDGVGAYRIWRLPILLKYYFNYLSLITCIFILLSLSIGSKTVELHKDSTSYKCLPGYRPKGKQVNITMILSMHWFRHVILVSLILATKFIGTDFFCLDKTIMFTFSFWPNWYMKALKCCWAK